MWIAQEALWARLEMVHSPAACLLLARMHFHRCTCFQVSLGNVCLGEGKMSLFGEHIVFHYAAAAAKSLQSCPTLCDPIDGSPPGSPVPGILQARILEWVAISFSSA